VVEVFGGENSWSQSGTELQSVVTNADEAAGRRHQPAFLFLPARDMKEGGCSRWRFVPSVAGEVWKDGEAAISIGRKSLGGA
jgi:hypothetical protein